MLASGVVVTVLGSPMFQAMCTGALIGVLQHTGRRLVRGCAEPWLVRRSVHTRIKYALGGETYPDEVYEGCVAIEDMLVAYILQYKDAHWCPHMCNDRDVLVRRVREIAAAYFVPQEVVDVVHHESLEQLRMCMTAHGHEEAFQAYLSKTHGEHHEAP